MNTQNADILGNALGSGLNIRHLHKTSQQPTARSDRREEFTRGQEEFTRGQLLRLEIAGKSTENRGNGTG